MQELASNGDNAQHARRATPCESARHVDGKNSESASPGTATRALKSRLHTNPIVLFALVSIARQDTARTPSRGGQASLGSCSLRRCQRTGFYGGGWHLGGRNALTALKGVARSGGPISGKHAATRLPTGAAAIVRRDDGPCSLDLRLRTSVVMLTHCNREGPASFQESFSMAWRRKASRASWTDE